PTEVHPEGRDRVPGEAARRGEDRAVPAEDEEEVGLEPIEPPAVQLDADDLEAPAEPGEEPVEDRADRSLSAAPVDVDPHRHGRWSRRALSPATEAASSPTARSWSSRGACSTKRSGTANRWRRARAPGLSPRRSSTAEPNPPASA